MRPKCPYCGSDAEVVTGAVLYGQPWADYAWKKFWRCAPCGAHVGCHGGTETPLGTLANGELRAARSKAHAVFDPLWKTRGMPRVDAYAWLARELEIPRVDCHIGQFNLEQCARVLVVVAALCADLGWR